MAWTVARPNNSAVGDCQQTADAARPLQGRSGIHGDGARQSAVGHQRASVNGRAAAPTVGGVGNDDRARSVLGDAARPADGPRDVEHRRRVGRAAGERTAGIEHAAGTARGDCAGEGVLAAGAAFAPDGATVESAEFVHHRGSIEESKRRARRYGHGFCRVAHRGRTGLEGQNALTDRDVSQRGIDVGSDERDLVSPVLVRLYAVPPVLSVAPEPRRSQRPEPPSVVSPVSVTVVRALVC